jgi:undecaprenyl-diphosphatase
MLVIIGILFILLEKRGERNREINDLRWYDSLLIGFAQALALIPGTSRSGITIIGGLLRNLKREAAVKFSFLLSLPAIAGAAVKSIIDWNQTITGIEMSYLVVAFLASTISGLLTIKYFLRFINRHSFIVFAYYRIILAIIILIFLFI